MKLVYLGKMYLRFNSLYHNNNNNIFILKYFVFYMFDKIFFNIY